MRRARFRKAVAEIATGSIMYVIGELSHTVIAFDLSAGPTDATMPIGGFAPSVIPPTVYSGHQSMMDSAEICMPKSLPTTLFVTNRWERHIAQRTKLVDDSVPHKPSGDTIAIIMLSEDGRAVEEIQHVRTKLDVIRGLRLSDDEKYAAAVGQEGGGIEIYEIQGQRGEKWERVASVDEGLGNGIEHVVWY